MSADREYYRRHLPHWQPPAAIFFVTFRLKCSLPKQVITSLRGAQEAVLSEQEPGMWDAGGSFHRWDGFLDQTTVGPCWLSQPDVARIITEAMVYRAGREYDLHAFCVMPNHVHAVFQILAKAEAPPVRLNKIMQSLKRHTARQANMILGREGAFWQDESYDHVVRNSEEFLNIIHYVVNNPVKAGLVKRWEDWPWTYCKETLR